MDGLVGNSSAGLIECAALGVRCVNVGPRQAGRDKPVNVIDLPEESDANTLGLALHRLDDAPPPADPCYGDGRTGSRVATLLAEIDLGPDVLRKNNTY